MASLSDRCRKGCHDQEVIEEQAGLFTGRSALTTLEGGKGSTPKGHPADIAIHPNLVKYYFQSKEGFGMGDDHLAGLPIGA